MREGVVAYDMSSRLAFVNPAFERLTGYPEEDLRDQEFLQYIHPDDRPALAAEWESLAEGGSLRDQEYRVVATGGQVRWSSSTWEPLRDGSGRQIGVARHRVRHHRAQAGRGGHAARRRAVPGDDGGAAGRGGGGPRLADGDAGDRGPRSAPHRRHRRGDRVHRGRGARPPGAHRDRGAAAAAGRQPVGPLRSHRRAAALRRRAQRSTRRPRLLPRLGVRSLLAVPLTDEQRTLGVLKVVSTRPAAFSDRDAKALRLLGGLMGAALGHAAAYESRQLRLEERTRALQESEQRFKQLVDTAQEGIWLADDHGVITYVNQRMAELLGYQNGAMLGRRVFDFIDTGSRASAQRTLARPSASGGESRDLRFLRRDGGELWGLVSASPIVGRDGGLVGTVGMVTDITERKRAEERLRRSAERLGDPARHGAGGARRALSGRDRPRGPRADPPTGSLPALLHRPVRLHPRARRPGDRRLRRRPPDLDRADPARHALPRRGAPARHRALRRGHRRPWRRRRRSSGSSCEDGLRSVLTRAAPGGRRGDRRGEPRGEHGRARSTRSTATSRWRSPRRSPSRSSTPVCATS